MKKAIDFLVIMVVFIAIISFFFGVDDYDLQTQLLKISNLTFDNPLDNFTSIYDTVTSFSTDSVTLTKVLLFIWNLVLIPFDMAKDLVIDIYNVYLIIMYLLGVY